MSVLEFLNRLPGAFDAEAADGAEGTIQLNVSTPAFLTIAGDTATLTQGTAADADVTLTGSDDDLIAILRGELDHVAAFLAGNLQVEGDLALAKDAPSFFDTARLS